MNNSLVTIGTGILSENLDEVENIIRKSLKNNIKLKINTTNTKSHASYDQAWNHYSSETIENSFDESGSLMTYLPNHYRYFKKSELIAEALYVPNNEMSFKTQDHYKSYGGLSFFSKVLNKKPTPWRLWIKGINA